MTSETKPSMPEEQLERMLIRGGMEPKDVFDMAAIPARCPSAVVEALSDFALSHGSIGTLREINQMCRALEKLTGAEQTKLAAAVQFAQPEYPFQIRHLAENLDQFEFVPGVKNDREYGEYMIRQSEQFEYDPQFGAVLRLRKVRRGPYCLAWRELQRIWLCSIPWFA